MAWFSAHFCLAAEDTSVITAMFRWTATAQEIPEDALKQPEAKRKHILAKWKEKGLV